MGAWPNLPGPAGKPEPAGHSQEPRCHRVRRPEVPRYPAGGTAGAAATRGRMYCLTALAKPSSSLEAVT